tara:strand:- start:22058 stop:22942 length:885 start_codon:yes stop_codon:yes gene_type:complete
MFKLIIVFITILNSAQAKLSFRWTGVSGFLLSDENSTLYFDPNITMVTLWDWMPWNVKDIDTKEVDYWMKRCDLKKVDAVFVNHSHYDHMLDAPYILKQYGGKLYGSRSTLNYGLGNGIPKERLVKIDYNKEYNVGKFTVIPLKSEHPNHFGPIMVSDGKINAPLKLPTHPVNFRLGKTHSFLIKHPEGDTLFSAVAKISEPDALRAIKANNLIVTMAKRGDTETFVKKRILPVQSKHIIPVHYDNFFIPLSRDKKIHHLPLVDFPEFVSTTKKLIPKSTELLTPAYCESVPLN